MTEADITDLTREHLARLERRIDADEVDGIRARWEFGRLMLEACDKYGRLPAGYINELAEWTGKSRSELAYRAQIARLFASELEISNALDISPSWRELVATLPSRRAALKAVTIPEEEATPMRQDRATRVEQIKTLAARGHHSRQIAAELELTPSHVRRLSRDNGVDIPADRVMAHTVQYDSNQIAANTVTALEGLVIGVRLVDIGRLDPAEAGAWAESLAASLATLNTFRRQIKEIAP